jgi:hypothetical protein
MSPHLRSLRPALWILFCAGLLPAQNQPPARHVVAISHRGGTYPVWSRGDLFFESSDQHIMAAAFRVLGDSFVADKPRLWSEKPIGGSAGSNKNIDLAPDGARIVALMPASEAKESQESQNHVVFLLNFFDELRRKAPVGK